MLEALFSSENVKKILLYLFVNRKCYGTLLQRTFNSALTPIQKALSRLEKAGVLLSYFEGKTKVYIFNSGCYLLEEIEALLKKVYLNLSSEEKRIYTSHSNTISFLTKDKVQSSLYEFWDRLKVITSLKMTVESGLSKVIGRADVSVECPSKNTIIFTEKGKWIHSDDQREFVNTFRWILDPYESLISLEHLRHGKNHPTFLFSLYPSDRLKFSSLTPMHCQDDFYIGKAKLIKDILNLHCRVIGPKKNEEISYCYS